MLMNKHCRYIRGNERKYLNEEFKGGIKPIAKYLECMQKHTPKVLVAVNIDGFGKKHKSFKSNCM